MTKLTEALEPRRPDAPAGSGYCLCESYARVTERAALGGARWLGRDDQEAAREAAYSGLRNALEQMPISARVVIGAEEDPEGLLPEGEIGAGGEKVDLAIDPLEGRGVVARGGYGAMAMVAVGEPDSLMRLPDMYMRKMAVGPAAREQIDLGRPVAENIQAIADSFGRRPNDITAIVLDRPRHHDLIEEIRAAGARIKLIQDGDVTASDLRRDPRHERPSRDRHRRDAAGHPVRGRPALPRRRAPGAALADVPLGDRGRARARDRRHDARLRAGRLHPRRRDRGRDRRLVGRPAARSPVPGGQRANAFACHVHAL